MSEDEERRGIRMDSEHGWPPRSQQGFIHRDPQSESAGSLHDDVCVACSQPGSDDWAVYTSVPRPPRRAES